MGKTISQEGLDLVKNFEGLFLKAYLCPAGIPTIGYGHTASVSKVDVEKGKKITKSEAERLLHLDLKGAEKVVNQLVKVSLGQSQFDALVSFVFNCGGGSFKNSTLLRKLNQRDYSGVYSELQRWTKARVNGEMKDLNGLIRRRKAEGELWLKGLYEVKEINNPKPENPTRDIKKSRTLAGIAIAGSGEVLQQAADQVNIIGDILNSDVVKIIGAALVIGGLSLAAYARIDGFLKGRV